MSNDATRAKAEAVPALPRLIDHRSMSAAQIMDCSNQARSIVTLCRHAADNMPAGTYSVIMISDAIEDALAMALDLMAVMNDALESHEGLGRKSATIADDAPASAAGDALDAVDQLCQVRDEMRVAWLALCSNEAEVHCREIGEHVLALGNRVAAVIDRMSGEPS